MLRGIYQNVLLSLSWEGSDLVFVIMTILLNDRVVSFTREVSLVII
jgi:hypothetical protein